MFARDVKRLILFVVPIFIILYTCVRFYRNPAVIPPKLNEWDKPILTQPGSDEEKDKFGLPPAKEVPPDFGGFGGFGDPPKEQQAPPAFGGFGDSGGLGDFGNVQPQDVPPAPAPAPGSLPDNGFVASNTKASHQEVFSASTLDKKYFPIDFGSETNGMNPNIIPHPTLENTWIVVAQEARSADEQTIYFTEIACNAAFQNGVLRCLFPPTALPIAPSTGGKCEGDLSFFNFNVGPHDARVLYGPEKPYTVYGSNSRFTCFGQFIQDFRELVDWGHEKTGSPDFRVGTELQRPAPWGTIEKNWFPFWDSAGQMYVHYDVAPKRVFAQVASDGSVSDNLAPLAAATDDACLAKYMPKLPPTLESIHQATNSLQITMCMRLDPSCVATGDNTFIFTIWQHKTFYNFHGVYEPYVMLFHNRAPFEIHAISKKPIWIHGRQEYPDRGTSDMFYVTSISWKSPLLKYHGYLDDELFISFGIEDAASGGIDLLAGDLLAELGLCNEN